jgi:hypothetical protein
MSGHPHDPAIMNIYAVGLALAGFDEQAGTAFVRANIRRYGRHSRSARWQRFARRIVIMPPGLAMH